MKNLPRFILLSATLGLATALSAQSADGGPRGRGRGPGGPGGHGGPGGPGRGHPVLRVLDNDQDRELSATELANAPSNLRALDLNADGSVTVDELRPPRPADAPTPPADRPARPEGVDHPKPFDPIMLALDANEDGSLSGSEINGATTSLSALDANKDGKLTADEFMPTPPEGAPEGRGPRRHGPPPAGTTNA
jgi:hypothetical protein